MGCGSGTSCDVFKAVRTGSSWTVTSLAQTADGEYSPDTDGTYVVYDSNRATSASGSDIYFTPVAGGPETQLAKIVCQAELCQDTAAVGYLNLQFLHYVPVNINYICHVISPLVVQYIDPEFYISIPASPVKNKCFRRNNARRQLSAISRPYMGGYLHCRPTEAKA
jgi:hypothetical protein